MPPEERTHALQCKLLPLCFVLLALAGSSVSQSVTAFINASAPGPPFTVGSAVNFTCIAVDTSNNPPPYMYRWSTQCNSCFLASLIQKVKDDRNNPMPELITQTVSTINGSSVRALTSADAGTITCEVLFSGNVYSNATLNISLTGFVVFDQTVPQTVQNNSYFIANSSEYFSVKLVCAAANSVVTWIEPGRITNVDNDVNRVISVVDEGTETVKLQQNAPMEIDYEGYYECALNQNQRIRVGLFPHSREPPNVAIPSSISGPEGGAVTLQCSVTGNPLPNITWIYNNTIITSDSIQYNIATTQSSSTLTILSLNATTMGNYMCVAENSITSVTNTTTVSILPPVEFLNVPEDTDSFPYDRHMSVASGDTSVLNCTAIANTVNGNIAPNISWMKDGTLITNSSNMLIIATISDTVAQDVLTVLNFTAADSGVYVCIASVNNVNITSDPIELTSGHNSLKLLTPSFVVVDPPVNVTIAVDAAGSYEHLVYDREQFSLLGQSEFNVSLSQFSNFFQNFTFFATEDNLPSQFVITSVGSVGQKNVTVDTIVVQYTEPSINVSVGSIVYVDEDDSISITCEADGAPRPSVIWIPSISGNFNTTEDTMELMVIPGMELQLPVTSVTLEIASASFPEHNSSFVCSARNTNPGSGNESVVNSTVEIVVLVPIEVVVSASRTELVVGQSVTLSCMVVQGNPTNYTYSWTFTSTDDENANLNISESMFTNFTILAIEEDQFGVYQCTVDNMFDSDQGTVNITQRFPPNITSISSTAQYVLVNDTVTLLCSAEGSPPLSYTWSLDGVVVNTTSDGVLTLADIQPDQYGTYTCSTTNNVGADEDQITIERAVPAMIVIPPSDLNITAPNDFTLVCNVSGIPSPTISWSTISDNSTFTEGVVQLDYVGGAVSMLQVNSSQQSDTDVYICTADNSFAVSTAEASVIVFVLPVVDIGIEITTVDEGDQFVANCTSTGNPVPSLSWISEGSILQTSDTVSLSNIGVQTVEDDMGITFTATLTLTIMSVTDTDSGNYVCQAVNVAGNDSASVDVTVNYAPRLAVSPQSLTINHGNDATFTCNATSFPLSLVNWTLGSQLLTDNDDIVISMVTQGDMVTSVLTLVAPNYGQPLNYTCNAANSVGNEQAQVTLTVQVLLATTSLNNTYFTNEMLPVTFQCTVTGIPTPNITWYRNGTVLTGLTDSRVTEGVPDVVNMGGVFTVTQTLTLNDTVDEDSDSYACVGSNPAGSSRSDFALIVRVAPVIVTPPMNITVLQGNRAIFSCSATGQPQPSITWTMSNGTILSGDKYIVSTNFAGSSMLIISETRYDLDAVEYVCVATNLIASRNASAILTVNVTPTISSSNELVVVNEADSASFQCSITGIPRPGIIWFRNGTHLLNSSRISISLPLENSLQFNLYQVTQTLTITNTADSDSGNYSCVGNNSVGMDTRTFVLVVQIAPVIVTPPMDITVLQGNRAIFSCSATGRPRPSITWTMSNGTTLSGDKYSVNNTFSVRKISSILTISETQYDLDAVEYVCVATNLVASRNASAILTVNVAPTINSSNELVIVNEFDSASFQCNTTGIPIPGISWFGNGTRLLNIGRISISLPLENSLQFNLYQVTQTLTIANTTDSDSGNYSCVGNNSVGMDTSTFVLVVRIAPVIVTQPMNTAVLQPNLANFSCSATGRPRPSITWTTSNGTILSGDKYSVNNTSAGRRISSVLTISETRYDLDAVEYFCVATNLVASRNASATLTVNVTPTITSSNELVTVNEFDSASFQCNTTGIPRPGISWFRNGTRLLNSGRISISSPLASSLPFNLYQVTQTLTINITTDRDSGNYSCVGNNSVGMDTSTVALVVQFSPRPSIQIPPTDSVSEGGTATFVCTVRGLPTPNVMWFSTASGEEQPVLTSDVITVVNVVGYDVVTSTLTLTSVTRYSAGNYICNATNILDTDFSLVILNVTYAPDIYQISDNQIVVQPNTATVSCSANANPRPVLRWFKNVNNSTQLMNSSSKYSISDELVGDRNITSILRIMDTDPSDAAFYVCQSMNDEGTATSTVMVTVHVIPNITSLNSIYVTNETSPVTFQCTATGIPTPSIIWLKGGTVLSSNSDPRIVIGSPNQQLLSSGVYQVTQTLTITNTADSDSGNYLCVGNNIAGSSTDQFELIVQIAPVITVPPLNQTTIQPNTTFFNCTSTGLPRSTLAWSRAVRGDVQVLTSSMKYDITEMVSGEREITSHLSIIGTVPSDAGEYTCTANNVVASDSASATLTVHVVPNILYPTTGQMFIVNQTDSLNINCNATGIPAPMITWYRNGSPLNNASQRITILTDILMSYGTDGGDVFLVNEQLVLSPANGSDTDSYSCTATNVVTTTTVVFNIFVQVPPHVVPLDGDREIIGIEEMSASIHFRIDNAAPPVTTDNIRWFFSPGIFTETPYDNGVTDITSLTMLQNSSAVLNYTNDLRTITISGISQSVEGRYFFMATNPAGTDYTHTDLIVHGPPRFIRTPRDQTIINTRDVTFRCEAAADPQHEILWSFNNAVIIATNTTADTTKYSVSRNQSDVQMFGSLTVHNVQYSDRGPYQCTAVNYVDSVSVTAILTVHVTPVVYNISSPLTAVISTNTSLFCVATGFPLPTIYWLKNGVNISYTELIQSTTVTAADLIGVETVSLPDGGRVDVDTAISSLLVSGSIPLLSELGRVGILAFSSVVRNDTANYTCVASNYRPLTGTRTSQSNPTTLTVEERPDPPNAVTVESFTARSVYLSWVPSFDGNLDIMGYNVYQNDMDREDNYTLVQSSQHPDYTTVDMMFNITSGIIPYTKYTFVVEACNSLGCSDRTGGMASSPIRTNTAAPDSPPRNCQVTAVSSTALNTSWLAPADPNGLITRYTVWYTPVLSYSNISYTSTSSNMTTTSGNTTHQLLTDLLKGTSYSINITAYTFVGAGPSSTDQCITYTLEDAPDGSPRNLSAYSDTSTSLVVKWEVPEASVQNGIITHHLVTYTSSRSGRKMVVNTTRLLERLKGLEIFTDYSITVAAGTSVGIGPIASIVIKTLNDTSSSPVDLIITTYSSSSISLSWRPPVVPNGVITSYRVYYTPSKSYSVDDLLYNSQQLYVGVARTNAVLTDLYPDSTYNVYVTAFNGAGEGNRSASVEQYLFVNTSLIEVPPLRSAPDDPNSGGLTYTISLTQPSSVNGRISHYQVIAVLLGQDASADTLPAPDVAFPNIESFSDYDTVGDVARMSTSGYAGYIAAEFGQELFPDDGLFTVGDPMESANDRSGSYPNNPLQYGSRYRFFLRAYPLSSTIRPAQRQYHQERQLMRQYSVFTSSGYTDTFETDANPVPPIAGGVFAGILVALVITAIVVIVVVMYWRIARTGKLDPDRDRPYEPETHNLDLLSVTSDIPLTTMVQPPVEDEPLGHSDIPVAKFEHHVKRLHANQNGLFAEEYKNIVENSPKPSMDVGLNPDNKCRNRYANIQCYDHSRVKLMPVDEHEHDYINANFLTGYNREREYIASQGPLPDTVGDFWRMVWDHDACTIVMLTNLVEKMKVKCSQYWPDSCGLVKYANVSVSMLSTEKQADCVIRNFEIVADGFKETRKVKQFHFTAWPDFGVPRHALPVLQLVRQVRKHHKYTDTRPMVVHCSAGVGRTGTFITIDVEMQRFFEKGVVNPQEFVVSMRKNRNHMVQTESQYVFLHDAILEGVTTGWTDFTVEQLPERMAELEEVNEEGESGYYTEFNRLRMSSVDLSEFQAANMKVNTLKNKLLNALPFDHNRVKLKKRIGEEGSDYINASFIDGYQEKNTYIATQGPSKETVLDFWRMIWEQESAVIVMLTQTEERGQEMCVQYWPKEGVAEMAINGFAVAVQSEQHFGDYVHRMLKVTEATKETSSSRIIHQLQFLSWPESGAPSGGSAMIDLVGQVVRVQQQTGNKPIVVHCSAGIGRTGAFCALSIAIERVKAEGFVNVFQTVKHLRTQRPHMVQTLEQYIFCYRAVLEYVDSLSPYANFRSQKK